jgi:hypothetical protein
MLTANFSARRRGIETPLTGTLLTPAI